MQKLLDLIYEHDLKTWGEMADEAFKELFGGATGRYPDRAKNAVQIRAPKFTDESNIPFATLIEPSNPKSGAYGGMSVGVFPVDGEPCLVALGTGTAGLHPDEAILARPGHARKEDWRFVKRSIGAKSVLHPGESTTPHAMTCQFLKMSFPNSPATQQHSSDTVKSCISFIVQRRTEKPRRLL